MNDYSFKIFALDDIWLYRFVSIIIMELKNNDKIKYEIYNCYNSCELGYFFSLVYCWQMNYN